MWRPNLGSQAGLSWGMPDVAMTQAGEDFRFAADTHCLGLYFDLFWLHWATQGPHYYALAHLAWNPHADVAAVMDDYYQRGFGPAAADVKAYWQLLERTRMEFVAEEPSRHRAFDLPKKYTPELFAQAQSHLDAAAAKLAGADEKYRRRLHFIQCGLDYAKLVVETRAWMQKLEASKGKDADAKAKVLANWQRVEQMKKEFPEFAINWQAVFRAPGGGGGDGNNASWACIPTPRSAAGCSGNCVRRDWNSRPGTSAFTFDSPETSPARGEQFAGHAFGMAEQFRVVRVFEVFAHQFDVHVTGVTAAHQRGHDGLQGQRARSQPAAILFAARRLLGVAQLDQRDPGRQFRQAIRDARQMPEMIGVEDQFDVRAVKRADQLQRFVQVGQKGPAGRTADVHRLQGQCHAAFLAHTAATRRSPLRNNRLAWLCVCPARGPV